LILQSVTFGDDWPQWLGPNRDSVWREKGIVERFPSEGLPVRWRVPVELGYTGPAVAGGRAYLMDYGCDDSGALMAVRLSDGARLWQTIEPTSRVGRRRRYATVFLVKHEDRFFLFSETGDLILAKLSPEGYEEISRFHVLEPTVRTGGLRVVWSHPAFANRCVFVRNDKELVCVSLAANE